MFSSRVVKSRKLGHDKAITYGFVVLLVILARLGISMSILVLVNFLTIASSRGSRLRISGGRRVSLSWIDHVVFAHQYTVMYTLSAG